MNYRLIKSTRLSCFFKLVGVLLSCSASASETLEVYSPTKFLEDQSAFFEKSDSRSLLSRQIKQADIDEKIAVAFDPWSVLNSVKGAQPGQPEKVFSFDDRATVKYADPRGYSAEAYAQIQESSDRSQFATKSWQALGFQMGYEFNKTADQYRITRKVAEAQKVIAKLGVDGNYFEQRESFLLSSLALYNQHCRLQDKKKLESSIRTTVKIADTQLASKSIDIEDYIRINDLWLSFQGDIQRLEDAILESEKSISSISEAAGQLAKNLKGQTLACEKILEEAKKLDVPSEINKEQLIKSNLSLVSLQHQKELSSLELKSYLNQARSSLQLSAGVDSLGPSYAAGGYQNIFVGLNFSYSFRESEFDLKKVKALRRTQDLDLQYRIREDSLSAKISQILDSMRSTANFAAIAKKSHENTVKGLEVTTTRQELGMINATGIYSAYSNFSSSVTALRDLWLTYKSNEIRLDTLKRNLEKTNPNERVGL